MTLTAAPATRPAPAEPTTPIRPSEAIRLGCLIAPVQAFMDFGSASKACVLGAMVAGYLGYGDEYTSYTPPSFGPAGDALGEIASIQECPACSGDWQSMCYTVPEHLNDDHRWTREAIADWLAGQGY